MSMPLARPMRILQVIETGGPGGAETILVELSGGLQRRGHQVSALVGGEGWLATALRDRSVAVESHRSSRAFDLALLMLLVRRIRAERIDIVHAHLFGGALYAGLAAAACGIPAVVTLHGQTDVRDSGLRMQFKRRILRRTVRRIVLVSESLRLDIAPILRASEAAYRVILNGVSSADTPLSLVPEISRRIADIAWAPKLVAVGNIRVPKGYPVLLDALAHLKERFPTIRLRIAGQPDRGELIGELKAQVLALGLSDNVEFLGYVEDPASLFADADCFVLASHREGFSLATIEAMLVGTPVVATRSGGPEEILMHEETGLLVPPSDPLAFSEAVARILDDPDGAHDMAVRAQVRARERYSLESMVAAYESLYEELIALDSQRRRTLGCVGDRKLRAAGYSQGRP